MGPHPHPHAADADADAGREAGAASPVPAARAQALAHADTDPGLAALRARGAQRFDPSGWRYLEALQRRARAQQGRLHDMLVQRLAQAVQAYTTRYDAALAALEADLPSLMQHHPQASGELRRLHAAGDIAALRQRVAGLTARPGDGPLAALLRVIDGAALAPGSSGHGKAAGVAVPGTGAPAELRTVQRFRDTWSRLRVDEQMARSQQQAPDNPGPLNSHRLVLRALRCMQETAPAYLARFIVHAETLSWLETADVPRPAATGKPAAARDRRTGKGAVRRGR